MTRYPPLPAYAFLLILGASLCYGAYEMVWR